LTKCKNYLEEEKDLWSNLSSTLEDNMNVSNNIRNKYEEAVQDYVNCYVVPSCHSSQNLGSDHFIAEQLPLIKKRIKEVMNKYRNIFSCLDRFHTYERKIPTLTEVSTKLLVS
jgi:cephalosporin hydroxylase